MSRQIERPFHDGPEILFLDDCQGAIFQMYITEKMPLKDVMQSIEQRYSVIASEATYKAKLAKWGYHKNTKRHEALAILRARKQRESMGKESTFFLKDRPVDMAKIENFAKRQQIRDVNQTSLFQPPQGELSINLTYKTPPRSPIQQPLSAPKIWRAPEKLLYHIDIYIKGSFKSKTWAFQGNELLILSSKSQPLERQSLHTFLGGIHTGCTNFAAGRPEIGGLYWRDAFREIDTLVKGSYHDIIPNLVQTVNDLNQRGYRDAAVTLMKYVAQSSIAHQSAAASIYGLWAELDLEHMRELESIIMARFVELFELYIGTRCYNSFVLRMNLARRKLDRGGISELDHCLPELCVLDETYGISNPRSLDVIRLRIETLYENGLHEQVESQACILLQRAVLIENDPWQNLYWVIKGWYYAGMAQYFLGNYVIAAESLKSCCAWINEFRHIDDTGLFDPEKIEVLEKLETMASVMRDEQGLTAWRSERRELLDVLAAKDAI